MESREDIYQIIVDTLSNYFNETFGGGHLVKIVSRFKGEFVIYPRLGFICHRFPSRKVIREMFRSYNVRNSLLKRIVARFYIMLCVFSFGLFAKKGLYFKGIKSINRDTLIIPNNRRIRIHYYDTMVADVLLKAGFDNHCYLKEINFRKNNSYDYIVPIFNVENDRYREPLIIGSGIIRAAKRNLDFYERMMYKELIDFQANTLKYVPVQDYFEQKHQQALSIINDKSSGVWLSSSNKLFLDKMLSKISSTISESQATIQVCSSHGDFQGGNVMTDIVNKKVYLIDWETIDCRSFVYDFITYYYNTRRKGKLKELLKKNGTPISDMLTNVGFNCHDILDENLYLNVFLIEDMLFYLEECSLLNRPEGSDILKRFIDEF